MDALLVNQPLVLDHGSSRLRLGISGESEPSLNINSYVARPKHDRMMIGSLEGNAFVGEKAQEHRGLMHINYPIKQGVVQNWEDLELIWQYMYNPGKLNSEDHPMLLTEAPLNPRTNRAKEAEVLFETFNVPAAYFAIPAVLALYASGKTTGLALDFGDSVCHSVPVYQGFAVKNAIMRSDLAGSDVTDFLQLLLRKQSVKLITSSEREIVKEIKEKFGYNLAETVRNQPENKDSSSEVFKLPDGQKINVEHLNLSRACELVFRPHIVGSEEKSVQSLVFDSISRSDMDLRAALYQNILLSGGGSQTRNFGDRILNELKSLAPTSTKLRIFAPPNRNVTSWIGGSILANLSTFKKMWITTDQWAEDPERIHKY